jgi:hypothetical protein
VAGGRRGAARNGRDVFGDSSEISRAFLQYPRNRLNLSPRPRGDCLRERMLERLTIDLTPGALVDRVRCLFGSFCSQIGEQRAIWLGFSGPFAVSNPADDALRRRPATPNRAGSQRSPFLPWISQRPNSRNGKRSLVR